MQKLIRGEPNYSKNRFDRYPYVDQQIYDTLVINGPNVAEIDRPTRTFEVSLNTETTHPIFRPL